LFGIYIG